MDRFQGLLVGTALGDSVGLPVEGLSPERAKRLFPGPWRQRLLPNTGLVSDDTEHAFFVTQSLLEEPNDPLAFARRVAWRLRWWLLAAPAGVGFATLRATCRLWLGVPPQRSGVRSAGNGAAMRAPLLGAYFVDDHDRRRAFVTASTAITHGR